MIKKLDFDIDEILRETPAAFVGRPLYELCSIYVATFHVGDDEYTLQAVFDLESDTQALVVANADETIINKIGE